MAELLDIRSVAPDLVTPAMVDGEPGPGRRARQSIPAYGGTAVHHALYLPRDWTARRRYPVIAEYAGNGNYKNNYGDISNGTVDGSNLGYGLSGGAGFIWICLPYVNPAGANETIWWGDADATAAYARGAIRMLVERYQADAARVVLAGFSRGAIGCNYIGLRDGETAKLWRAFFAYSHYDGVRHWPYADSDRVSARLRLERLRERPAYICHEASVEAARKYIHEMDVPGDFTFDTIAFRNHNDAWTLRDIPERRRARAWLKKVTT